MREKLKDWLLFPRNPAKLAAILVLPLLIILILLIATLARWEKKSLDEIQMSGLVEVGRAFYQHIMATTIWTRGHGGIYVEVPELTSGGPGQTDPGLHGVSIMGKKYQKVRPNFLAKGIADIINKRGSYYFHITSLNPASPENRPDSWEEESLRQFEKGVPETTGILTMNNTRMFRYMAPLALNESCLKCHQWGGYKLADLRGGISITIPMGYSDSLYARQMKRTALSFASIGVIAILFLMALVWYFSGRISSGFNLTLQQQEKLHRLNTQLSALVARDRKILENIGDGMVVIGADGTIEIANRVFLTATGLKESDIVGRQVASFTGDSVVSQVLVPYETGGDIQAPFPGDEGQFLVYRKNHLPESTEVIIGDRTYTASSIFVVNEEGGGYFCELRILHDATREMLKAAMELSGSAAHEIRQPLAILLSVKDLVRSRVEHNEDPSEELDVLDDQIERVNSIISKMLTVTTYKTRRYADDMQIFDFGGEEED